MPPVLERNDIVALCLIHFSKAGCFPSDLSEVAKITKLENKNLRKWFRSSDALFEAVAEKLSANTIAAIRMNVGREHNAMERANTLFRFIRNRNSAFSYRNLNPIRIRSA